MAMTQNRPLIALADDNRELRELLAAALEVVGYRVVQVATGAPLIAAVRDLLAHGEPLQLIITDVRLPTLDGLDAARSLRAAGRATPLIFMTAYGDAWSRALAAELGAQLLDKPVSLLALRRAVTMTIAA